MLSFFFFLEVKAQQYFVSSRNTFLDKKTLLKIGLFQEPGPELHAGQDHTCLLLLLLFLILSIRCACQPHQMGFLRSRKSTLLITSLSIFKYQFLVASRKQSK